MSNGHTGMGFLVGGLLGGASNRASELDATRSRVADLKLSNAELIQKVDELYQAGENLFGSQVRLKADYEGMRAVIRDLMAAIRDIDRESPMLLAKSRDTIAGEASRLSDEKNRDSMFSLQMSRRAGMMAVILACSKELARLDPAHRLLKADEQFASYWVAFQEELELRKGSLNQAIRWAQERSNTERYMLENAEFYDQVPAAWDKTVSKSGPKPS